MKTICSAAVLLLSVALLPTGAQGQGCPMYAYSDMWVDGNGNAIASNYTQADTSCPSYWSYADVTVHLPSGSSQSASAAGSCCAEAVVALSATNEDGQGSIDFFNEASFSCGTASFFANPVFSVRSGVDSIWYENPVQQISPPNTCVFEVISPCTGVVHIAANGEIHERCRNLDAPGQPTSNPFLSVLDNVPWVDLVWLFGEVSAPLLNTQMHTRMRFTVPVEPPPVGVCRAVPAHLPGILTY